jgi:hypothetical protein
VNWHWYLVPASLARAFSFSVSSKVKFLKSCTGAVPRVLAATPSNAGPVTAPRAVLSDLNLISRPIPHNARPCPVQGVRLGKAQGAKQCVRQEPKARPRHAHAHHGPTVKQAKAGPRQAAKLPAVTYLREDGAHLHLRKVLADAVAGGVGEGRESATASVSDCAHTPLPVRTP